MDITGLNSSGHLKYIEACLRCLRTLYTSDVSVDDIYREPSVLLLLVSLLNKSYITMECVTTILANCCRVKATNFIDSIATHFIDSIFINSCI